jgi:general secretion pathway protein N
LKKLLVTTGLVGLFLIVAVTQVPAYQAYRWFGLERQLQLGGLSGTLWQGRADKMLLRDYPLGSLQWQVHPADLLLLDLVAELEINGPDGTASGELSWPLVDGSTRLSALQASLPASWLQLVLQEPLLQLQGRLEINMEQLSLDVDGYISGLQGQMSWHQAAVAGDIVTPLGDLMLDWQSDGGTLVGEFSDSGGPLAMAGRVTIADGQYRVAAKLAARSGNPSLYQALNVLGRPGPDGWLALNINGPMIPLGELLQ